MRDTDKPPVEVAQPVDTIPYSKTRNAIISGLLALGAGLTASLMAILVMSFLRVVAGIPTPVELFGDFILKRLPAPQFVQLLINFSPNSKTAPLGLALLGMIGAGVVLGLLYALIVRIQLPTNSYRPTRREWLVALVLTLVLTLIGIVLFWEELRQNQFGFVIFWSSVLSILGLLADFAIFAVVLCLAYRAILPKQATPASTTSGRRLLLSRAGTTALGVGAAAGSLGFINQFLKGYASYDGTRTPSPHDVTAPITPNADHYIVTQNTVDPTPDLNLWRLEVTGLVNNPGSYTYEEMQQLPSTSRAVTLECISNEVGANLMSTAVWQGVTLKTLIDKHGGTLPDATYVAFYSVDGYTVSQPLKELLAVDTLFAWRMNGVELPMRHGFPLRALVLGHYGEENPKWLTRLEFTDHFVGGLYSDQGWYNGPIHLTSRIDHPKGRIALGQPVPVGGIAYGGSHGIQKVEVSTDGGSTWNVATLQPPLSQDAWVLWSWQWRPIRAENYMLEVRATDGMGELQSDKAQGTVPGGSKGIHKVVVTVG